MKTSLRFGAVLAVAALAAGCATDPVPATAQAAPAAPAAAPAPAELFVVLPETGRVHAFGDTKNYFDFLAHGEVALTRTQVGAGPGGKTLVFGITSADVKANRPSRGEQVLGGALPAGTGFYGEAYRAAGSICSATSRT